MTMRKLNVTLSIEAEDNVSIAEMTQYARDMAGTIAPPKLSGRTLVVKLVNVRQPCAGKFLTKASSALCTLCGEGRGAHPTRKCEGCEKAQAFANLVAEGHEVHPSNVKCPVHGKAAIY
jgi:hypothetical protein